MKNTLLFVFALILAACSSEYPKDAKKYDLHHIGSDLRLEVYTNGETFFIHGKKKDKANPAIMLAYMSDKCQLCLDYVNTLNNLANKNLKVIALAPEDFKRAKSDNEDFMIFSSTNLLSDIASRLKIPFDNSVLLILYDSDGKYVNFYQGHVPQEILSLELQKLEK